MPLGVPALRALAHPIRLRILSLLTGAAMSAAEIARELDISQANASYHVRTLATAGYLEEVGEESIRGGVAKRYAYVPGPPPEPVTEPDAEDLAAQALVYQAIAEELVRRSRHYRPVSPLPQTLTDAELWLDPEDWKAAVALVREASEILHRRAHPPRTAGTLHVNATIALFGMADDPHDETAAPTPAPTEVPPAESSESSESSESGDVPHGEATS